METLPPGVSSFPDSILPFCDLLLSAPGSEQANPDPQSLRGGAAESSGGPGRHLQVRMSRICRFTTQMVFTTWMVCAPDHAIHLQQGKRGALSGDCWINRFLGSHVRPERQQWPLSGVREQLNPSPTLCLGDTRPRWAEVAS